LLNMNEAISRMPEGIESVISKLDGHHINECGHKLYADAIFEAHAISLHPPVSG